MIRLELENNEVSYITLLLLQNKKSYNGDEIADKIKRQVENQKDEIGRTTVIWRECDVSDEFEKQFDRKPTNEELRSIIDDYIAGDLDDKGGEAAIEVGWNRIFEALDDWRSDNIEDENEEE